MAKEQGVHELISRAVTGSDIDFRLAMQECVLLTGGSCKVKGLAKRLELELLDPNVKSKYNIMKSEDMHCAAWLGGALISRISSFEQSWISQRDYKEYGDQAVHRKCVNV